MKVGLRFDVAASRRRYPDTTLISASATTNSVSHSGSEAANRRLRPAAVHCSEGFLDEIRKGALRLKAGLHPYDFADRRRDWSPVSRCLI